MVLRKSGTQQICQLLRVSIAASAYASRHGRIKKIVTILFCDHMVSATLVNGSHSVQLILESNLRMTESTCVNINTLTIFEFPNFSLLVSLSRRVTEKDADYDSNLSHRYGIRILSPRFLKA